jgi:hypothetical protein
MKTLGIVRRAMQRALQWRLLLLSPIALLIAAAATLFPLAQFFGELFDHSPRWQELTEGLDSAALAGIFKAFSTPSAAGLAPAVQTSVVLAVLIAPFLAGAALFVAESEARSRWRGLLTGAAGYYPRLLRMQLAALVPLGIAAAIAAVAFRWASGVEHRATSEAATHTSARIAWIVSVVAVFLGQLVIDAGRARLAAEPERRSVVKALGAGVKLIVKRPLHTLSVGASATLVALVVAAALLVVRQQITQSSATALLLAFVFAQLAVASIAWGHAAKLAGLVEIARELVASRGSGPKVTVPDEPGTLPSESAVPPADVLAPELPAALPPQASSPEPHGSTERTASPTTEIQ